ncbi:hypothetical protein G7Z17_g4872 [Cylindrodendrum hubeiense]|uniref:Mesaconyl-C4 CoA hydratase n=1 Tax=Cylindrodendrum hubeiense TaxID=595255 RepID=A0A9P5HBY6_9HYPO|nr:hypothetical protein G7Z17_g4872 [Cylindrodendrum hubeiense]
MDAIKARPPKIIPDYLTPMSSHLLTTTLTDLLHSPRPSSPTIASPPHILPQGHHLVYFPIQLPPSALIPDGADPGHSPGAPFTRRVWAGGELTFGTRAAEMRLDGRPVMCREKVEDVELRGKDGDERVFVDVWRKYGLGHEDTESRPEWEIEERHPHPPSHSLSLTPSPTHLFHFSALSFNAHAIHFDPFYARDVDGHRALLVHGPLTLTLMLRVLADRLGEGVYVRRFTYRNHAPLYVNERMTVSLRKVSGNSETQGRWDVWVEGPEGGLAVKGTAEVVPMGENKKRPID